MARAGDIPKSIAAEFLATKLLHNAPYGAKDIGEVFLGGWPAAIANALYRAAGDHGSSPEPREGNRGAQASVP